MAFIGVHVCARGRWLGLNAWLRFFSNLAIVFLAPTDHAVVFKKKIGE